MSEISRKNNGMATTGFVLGLISVFLYMIGLIPILAIVFSAVGLGTFKPNIHKNKWMAELGWQLGIVYTIMGTCRRTRTSRPLSRMIDCLTSAASFATGLGMPRH